MTSLTERFPAAQSQTVSPEGGGSPAAPLAAFLYQDMRWCVNCGGDQIFVPVFLCDAGQVGYCLGCGEERVIRFTRTNSEAC
ncbi:MAG TPA: hypothetical protein VKP61_00750 [Candidatus Acidoferrum sp.]|nr:hypothetical protein [Candidatus Acidoferrum sp.]